MDLLMSDMGTAKEDGSNLQCNYCDTDIVHNITELLLRGLAKASVDSTTGYLFRSPSSVAVDVKSEMVDYLIQKTQTFVSESVTGGEDNSDQLIKASTSPTDFLSDLIDDFVSSKRNLLSHVSRFLFSESKIKDFVQKMEMDNFWSLERRKAFAEIILKNMDIGCLFHCPERVGTPEKLAEHRSHCKFRPVNCTNNECIASFSAVHVDKHGSICPFKVLPCEQLCQQLVMRREMDRHCTTVCPMKLINCPFHHVGCKKAFPQCTLEKHCSEFLQSHLFYVLQVITRQDASVSGLNQRVQLLEKAQSLNELSGALDVRSLTLITKEQEAKIKKLDHELKAQEAKMTKLENEFRSSMKPSIV